MLWTWVVATIAWAECTEPTRSSDLVLAIGAAEASFAAMDLDRFQKSASEADHALECLGEVFTPFDAATYHRLGGLKAFVARDDARTIASFASLLAIQPEATLPSTIAPEGHPLRERWEQARAFPVAEPVAMDHPAEGVLYVDGSRNLTRAPNRPVILQMLDFEGAVAWTRLVEVGEEPPSWEAATTEQLVDLGIAPRSALPLRKRLRAPLLVTAGVSAIAAGTFYGLAITQRDRFEDPRTDPYDLEGLRDRNHAYCAGSATFGVLALGAGAVVVIPW